MKLTAADLATSLITPSIVTGAALIAEWQYGGHAAVVEFLTALATGKLAFVSFAKKWSPTLSWGALAMAGAFTQAGVTTVGSVGPAAYAWLISSATAVAARLVYRHHTRHDDLKVRQESVKLDTALIRQQMAHHQLLVRTTPDTVPAGPDLSGRTVEEQQLRTAVWEALRQELAGCHVEATDVGWRAVADCPPTLDRDTLRTRWPKVAGALRVDGAFHLDDGPLTSQLVINYVDGDPLDTAVPYESERGATFLDPVVVSRDEFGQPVAIEMAYSHTLIAGSSKFGKSTLVRLIAIRLAGRPDTVLYGVDMKPGSPELSPMRPILQDLASTPEEAHALMDWMRQELDERGAILAEDEAQEWIPARHGRPAVYVIVDEHAELVRQGDKGRKKGDRISDKVESFLALNRAYGIHMISATQQPSSGVFGGKTDARGNYAVRISTRMNDRAHAMFVFGRASGYNPGDLTKPGEILVNTPDHVRPFRSRVQWLRGEDFRREVARLARETAKAPVGKRLILPAPGATQQEKVRNALAKYGNMQRRELEQATGLGEKQVLDAARALRPDVERCEDTGTWRIVPSAAWEAQAVASP
ncbi:FtsK/SpoIIIE domain-containing protein [Streptomyces sp. NPDC086182]|uniref:FtsK/SpoIIIE domain-containing protein n=1 Tax=Streptomyces sp. NPDC086182 TaxID=3155058 RepID=UPI003423176A